MPERIEQANPTEPPHSFHIPVMGTGFTVDTPLRVARYGITSVVSIGDDILVEQMRGYHSRQHDLAFEAIGTDEEDYRARRITAYLNLLHELVEAQVEELRRAPFESGSDITRYFELLPESPLKQQYRRMQTCRDAVLRRKMQDSLRSCVTPGRIDVNIMTKVDGDRYQHGRKLPPEECVAMSALRGFAQSKLRSAVVFSAGMNRRLYTYAAEFPDFLLDGDGCLRKKIILKVSDFRSAHLQGKLLASRGLWVSEYRVESGLNCGGHAFAAKGQLMGPILEEFRKSRTAMSEELQAVYNKALASRGLATTGSAPPVAITAQGGIGSFAEDVFIRSYYGLEGTGWGTPFLLVPEVTNVDQDHLTKLCEADRTVVRLSESSPLGVPFWNLGTSDAEETRRRRITEGRPGSSCPKGYLSTNTEFTERPICPASRGFQTKKLEAIKAGAAMDPVSDARTETVLSKACLCLDLAGGVLRKCGIVPEAKTAVCCGPGIADFSRIASLDDMVDHIYGRLSLLKDQARRHMFVTELELYVEYLRDEMQRNAIGLIERNNRYFDDFRQNLNDGIEYYRTLAQQFRQRKRQDFLKDLDELKAQLEELLTETIGPGQLALAPHAASGL